MNGILHIRTCKNIKEWVPIHHSAELACRGCLDHSFLTQTLNCVVHGENCERVDKSATGLVFVDIIQVQAQLSIHCDVLLPTTIAFLIGKECHKLVLQSPSHNASSRCDYLAVTFESGSAIFWLWCRVNSLGIEVVRRVYWRRDNLDQHLMGLWFWGI